MSPIKAEIFKNICWFSNTLEKKKKNNNNNKILLGSKSICNDELKRSLGAFKNAFMDHQRVEEEKNVHQYYIFDQTGLYGYNGH